jgi:hypothetical protein
LALLGFVWSLWVVGKELMQIEDFIQRSSSLGLKTLTLKSKNKMNE